MHERDFVGARRDMRHQVADPLPTLAPRLPLPGALHDSARLALEQLDLSTRVELLAVTTDQLRLVVERVALARGARHEELHHALRPRRKMGLRAEHPRQCDSTQPASEV